MSQTNASDRAHLLGQGSGCALEEVRELICLAPKDHGQLAEVLGEARRRSFSVLPIGAGSQLAWCRPDALDDPANAPIPISLMHLAGVLEQIPGEGTVTAQAGTPWRDLAQAVEQSGECLPADLPGATTSTLGGILGAGRSGPNRLRYGPLRHHVLGMQVMLSDGTLAKSGGRLVKNVTGFDLHRLYTGSRGTLAIILEASLRLMALPEREWSFCIPVADCASGFTKALEIQQAMPRLHWLVLTRTQSELRLQGGLAGRASQVKTDQERVLTALGGTPESFDGQAPTERKRLGEEGAENRNAWEIGSPLTHCAELLGTLEAQLPTETNLWVDCGTGRILVGPAGDAPVTEKPSWAETIGAEATSLRPLCVHRHLHDQWTESNPTATQADWQQRLTRGLDPAGIFSMTLDPEKAPA
jgi:hypothetical protein